MLRCNEDLFNYFLPEIETMPQAKQRRPLSSFDARSVMLFAALTVGGALAQAQTSSTTSAQPKYQAGPGPASTQPQPVFGGSAPTPPSAGQTGRAQAPQPQTQPQSQPQATTQPQAATQSSQDRGKNQSGAR
jgi:hypothetical protein